MTEEKKSNPANEVAKKTESAGRIPMSIPQLKLEAPEIPGYHCHWMRGTGSRIQQALRAGYTFVEYDEVGINNFDLGGDAEDTGNTDLGSRVSLVGDSDDKGNAVRLYLMKLPLELWEKDQQIIADRNEQTAAALRGEGRDVENAYVPESHRKSVAKIYQRKT